jgi:transposase-like protein
MTSGLERLDNEVERRTRGVKSFPNEASRVWLATPIRSEIRDNQGIKRAYLIAKPDARRLNDPD